MFKKISLIISILFVIIYDALLAIGMQPQIWIMKIAICIILGIIGINIFLGLKNPICKLSKANKIIAEFLLAQVEVAICIVIMLLVRNIDVNAYLLEKDNIKYVMSIDINNNIKQYYKYYNFLLISKEPYIEEQYNITSDTIPLNIKYNKKKLKDAIDLEIISSNKKIMEAENLKKEERIVEHISNIEELKEFEDKYKVKNSEYNEEFFKEKDIVALTYSLFKESVPMVAYSEDNNIYLYVQSELEDLKYDSLLYIEIDKHDVNNINIRDFNTMQKNNYL